MLRELKDWEITKLQNGEWLTVLPFGYNNDAERTIVQYIFSMYSSGEFSMLSLKKHLSEDYNFDKHIPFICNMLNNKFYIGTMSWKGHEFPHKYGSIIDKEIFEKCQEIKDKNILKVGGINLKRNKPKYDLD